MNPLFGHTLHVRNVSHALPAALHLLKHHGQPFASRGMATREYPGPVMTVYDRPTERWLRDPVRDANPFFHMIDALWLLSGSQRAALPVRFLPSLARFSDDGRTFHGAYGYRLRRHFDVDQLHTIKHLLRAKPDTRQAVMSIWDPETDLGADTKDMPCNDMLMWSIRDGDLNLTVNNRSNDAVWGAYGANAVQFSVLQEVMAWLVGARVGRYVQVSNSLHVYEDNPYWQRYLSGQVPAMEDPYVESMPHPLVENYQDAMAFIVDCETLARRAEMKLSKLVNIARPEVYTSRYFLHSVCPMINAYEAYRADNLHSAIHHAHTIHAWDLRAACVEWLERRMVARAGAAQ